MKVKEKTEELVHVIIDSVRYSLSMAEIKALKPIAANFHDNSMLKFTLKNGEIVTGIVKNYTYEEIFSPHPEAIPLQITLESDIILWFYEIKKVEVI